MNNYFVDIGWQSHNKHGELLCGDHVEIARKDEDQAVVVLADGLGSGVKANILSTLTSKIISTMMAENLSVEECVSAITATLPVCKERNLAYSTFTILRINADMEAEIIQFDNPHLFMLRNGKNTEYQEMSENIGDKTIYKSRVKLRENDIFMMFSDGLIGAGTGNVLNPEWQRPDIIKYMETMYMDTHTAKGLTTILSEHCLELYAGKPGDDSTVCTVKIRPRTQVNLLIGPPANPADVSTMMSLFFSRNGKHIICGGTTSQLASEHLKKPLLVEPQKYMDPKIPPTAVIEGVDLVTEGIITISKVLEYAKDYLNENDLYFEWMGNDDGASQIVRLLIEEATDINFFVGRAVNPAHQNPGLPINFNIKMHLVEQLAESLRLMDKPIKVTYF
jgi:hypothetical protein